MSVLNFKIKKRRRRTCGVWDEYIPNKLKCQVTSSQNLLPFLHQRENLVRQVVRDARHVSPELFWNGVLVNYPFS